jgi:predicted ABC-type ATPase
MSGKDKIELLQTAKQRGYRTYLYYICTDDVIINKDRVSNRIEKGGHPVPEEKVKQRYYRSLDQLLNAIKLSDRAYLFDNSGTEHKLVAEITDGRDIEFNPSFIPNWFEKYVLQKLNA